MRIVHRLVVPFCALVAVGCGAGGARDKSPEEAATQSRPAHNQVDSGMFAKVPEPADPETLVGRRFDPAASQAQSSTVAPSESTAPAQDSVESETANAASTPAAPHDAEDAAAASATADVDERRLQSAGVRKLASNHLTLYTDLAVSDEVDRLPALFDQAVTQWRAFFDLEPHAAADWRATARIMREPARFAAAGLLPVDLPEFTNGYSRGNDIWMHEQPSDYYRRHLLLHEGTHAFMFHHFGDCGPLWYMEGLAELLGTHAMVDGRAALGHFPRDRDETPMWGRIKMVRDAADGGRPLELIEIMSLPLDAHHMNENYGWTWGVAAFLDGHPRFRAALRGMHADVQQRDFNDRFVAALGDDWPRAAQEWRRFVAELDYGYDAARAAIEYGDAPREVGDGAVATVQADRGWQSSGVRVEAGQRYQLTASGQFELAQAPRPWISEAQGVSIRYWKGRPLGKLLATVVPDAPQQAPIAEDNAASRVAAACPWLAPIDVGAEATIAPEQNGTLFLKLNDSPAELADNRGQVQVRIEPAAD